MSDEANKDKAGEGKADDGKAGETKPQAFVEGVVYERGKMIAQDERGKELWEKYRVSGRHELLQYVKSDSQFALNVVECLLGMQFGDDVEVAERKSSGIDGDAGDYTQAGRDSEGYPVAKGSAEDVS